MRCELLPTVVIEVNDGVLGGELDDGAGAEGRVLDSVAQLPVLHGGGCYHAAQWVRCGAGCNPSSGSSSQRPCSEQE